MVQKVQKFLCAEFQTPRRRIWKKSKKQIALHYFDHYFDTISPNYCESKGSFISVMQRKRKNGVPGQKINSFPQILMRDGSQKCVILDAVAARRSGPAFLLISLRKKLIFWSKDLVRYTLGHASQSD